MQRLTYFVYGVLCHAMFLAVFLYMVGFLANAYVSKSIDSGAEGPFGQALLINLALLALFVNLTNAAREADNTLALLAFGFLVVVFGIGLVVSLVNTVRSRKGLGKGQSSATN